MSETTIRLDRYCEHCGYATNVAECMGCGRPTKQLHAAAQGRDDLYVCLHGSMAPFPCVGGDSVKLQPAPAASAPGETTEREEWVVEREEDRGWKHYAEVRGQHTPEEWLSWCRGVEPARRFRLIRRRIEETVIEGASE